MDQIRSTLMRHEELFKEQVQALHKLYGVQKSAMKEIRRVHSQPPLLACNSKNADDRYSGSVFEGKLLRPAYATDQACKDELLNLSLHPSSAVDCRGFGLSFMDRRGVETLQTIQSKVVRNFDLEKLPEECMSELDNQIDLVSSKTSYESSSLSKRTTNPSGDSSAAADLSVIQVDSPSLEQIHSERNLRILSGNGQEFIQKNWDGSSEEKSYRVNIAKLALSFSDPNGTSEDKTSQELPRIYLPAFSKSEYQDARHNENQTLMHQGSSSFMTSKHNPLNSGKDDPEKFPEQGNNHLVEGLFLKNPAICSQGSSTLDFLQYNSTYNKGLLGQSSFSLKTNSDSVKQDLNSFPLTSRTSEENEVESPNDSANGSNSIQSQYTGSSKDKDTSIYLKKTYALGDGCGEAVQTSQSGEETTWSECEDGCNPLLSSLSDPENKHMDHSMCSDSKSTMACSEKPVLVIEGNEHLKENSALRETCESIAAEILLSMAPNTAGVAVHLHGATEPIKWAKTDNRRTRRRPR